MATLTVDGIYKDGRIELERRPANVDYSRVRVTFLVPTPDDEAADERGAPEHGRHHVSEPRNDVLARVIGRMKQGIDLGGPPYAPREELHDRLRRFE
jgi:hypothetical protein